MTDPARPLLVDVHAHFLTPRYVDAAIAAGHEHPDGMPGWPTWDAARHVELMDTGGIATALLSISSPGTHFGHDAAARELARHVNDAGAEIRRARPRRQLESAHHPQRRAALPPPHPLTGTSRHDRATGPPRDDQRAVDLRVAHAGPTRLITAASAPTAG